MTLSGGNSTSLLHRIDRAIAKGDLNRGTTTVLISTGFNDYAPMNVMNGASGDFRDIQNVYVRNLHTAAGKIRCCLLYTSDAADE